MAAAIGWGVADYSAALSSRRIGALWTSLGMQIVGTLTLAVALLALGRWPDLRAEAVPWALILAATGAGSLYLLYRGMALGPIAVVSPVVASYAAIAVILIVVFLGERLTAAQAIAVGVTFVGVALSTTDVRRFLGAIGQPLPGLRISFLATIGFAVWATLLAAASRQHDGMALVLLWRMAGIGLLLIAVLALRARPGADRRPSTFAMIATVGVFDTAANVAFVLGVQSGHAAITATGSGMYPLVPAFLAIAVLGERLAPNQYLGILVLVLGLVGLGLTT